MYIGRQVKMLYKQFLVLLFSVFIGSGGTALASDNAIGAYLLESVKGLAGAVGVKPDVVKIRPDNDLFQFNHSGVNCLFI